VKKSKKKKKKKKEKKAAIAKGKKKFLVVMNAVMNSLSFWHQTTPPGSFRDRKFEFFFEKSLDARSSILIDSHVLREERPTETIYTVKI